MKTIMLEGYGSYSGEKAEAVLIGTNGKHITLRAANPLNPKETTDANFRLADGMKVGSSPERGFMIPRKVVNSITGTGSNEPTPIVLKKGTGIQLKTVVKKKTAPVTLKKTNGNSKSMAVAEAPKRGPGRPRKNPVEAPVSTPVKVKTVAKAAPEPEVKRGRGRPPKAAAAPLPKGQARVMLSKGIADYVVSQIKPKTSDENLRSLRAAITGGVHTNYVEVILSKELAQTLLDFLGNHYEKFGTMGVTGGAFKRGIPSLIERLGENFKALKVPATLKGGSAPAPKTVAKAPEPTPVKRGPGRPPKNAAPPVAVAPVKKGIVLKKRS